MTVVLARHPRAAVFAFRWGMTARIRRESGWLHLSVNVRRNAWRHDPSRSSVQVQVESWRTDPGVSDRVMGSKRYVRLKVAL